MNYQMLPREEKLSLSGTGSILTSHELEKKMIKSGSPDYRFGYCIHNAVLSVKTEVFHL